MPSKAMPTKSRARVLKGYETSFLYMLPDGGLQWASRLDGEDCWGRDAQAGWACCTRGWIRLGYNSNITPAGREALARYESKHGPVEKGAKR